MRPVVVDFETYFGDDFTLSKMSTEAYIRDGRFKAHGAAIKWSANHDAKWYNEDELRYVLAQEDWSDVFLICHHTNFDGLILSHHYGVVPKMYGCTMSMARAAYPTHVSVSLESVRERSGFPPKRTPYNLFRGKHWRELDEQTKQNLAEGCEDEVGSIWDIFKILAKDFPIEEFEVIDSVVRMFVNPVLQADTGTLARLWEDEARAKGRRYQELCISEADVQSAAKFQAILEAEGIEIGYKPNPKGEMIPAFAKNDDFMQELLEHDDERVRTLAEARIGAKSTLLQTRAETLGFMAGRGPLAVYLRYCGAATLRPTGGDGANWLNFKRGSDIRRSILAPDGYLLGPVDASQIECRVLNYLAGQEDVVEAFRTGRDPYVKTASLCYEEEIYKPNKDDPRKAEMEAKRGMGKQSELMCLGPDTLVLTSNGVKPIIEVSTLDQIWDGVEWVTHLGLISRGEKRVVNRKGVLMTSDHLVLCGNTWQPASRLKGNTLFQALATGSGLLPSQAMSWLVAAASSLSSSSATAERPNILSTFTIWFREKARVVWRALEKQPASTEKNFSDMPTFVLTKTTVTGFSLVSPLSTRVVAPLVNITPSPITGGVALRYMNLGSKINARFLPIWSRWKVGTIRVYRSIALITIKVTSPATYGSPIKKLKQLTAADCAIWRKKLPTYDLVSAGPRNRFTVVSRAGCFIVHNCGYGAAERQFQRTAKAGLYGPPVDLSEADSKRFVDVYRDTHPAVVEYWRTCNRIIARLAGGPPMEWGPFLVKDHKLILPSGQAMNYETLEFHKPGADEGCREFEKAGYWRMKVRRGYKKMWGSKLAQNICEMVSRVIVSQAMIRIKQKYGIRTLNWPYDELLLLIPDDSKAEETLELCCQEMCVTPSWLPGIPLDAEASLGKRYSK